MFNKKLLEFISDLILVCPDINPLKVFKMSVNMATITDKKLPESAFYETVVIPYGKKVVDKDEAFFLSESYDAVKNSDLNLIEQLKGTWRTLDACNKITVWNYLQVLLVLSNKARAVSPSSASPTEPVDTSRLFKRT